MLIQCLGLSHNTADISVREKIALNEEQIKQFLKQNISEGTVQEIIVLSTCNRVEIYAAADENKLDELQKSLFDFCKIEDQDLASTFYKLFDKDTINHLFRVTAGLESLALGESQIIGQISKAYKLAHSAGATGKLLSKLFQNAMRVGKRVHTETAIGDKSITVPSLAVKLARKHFSDFTNTKVLLLGAGEMAELAVEAFRKRGADNFYVLSRTLAKACELAEPWQGKAGTMEMLEETLQQVDVLVSSSSAPHILIDKQLVVKVMKTRPDRPLVILDIAVPRDVDSDVNVIDNVYLYDIDSIRDGVEESQKARIKEIPKVEKIIRYESQLFIEFLETLKIVPVIKEIRQKAEYIRETEVEKTLSSLPELSAEAQDHIIAMTRSIVNQIMHSPTVHLREKAGNDNSETLSDLVRELFGISRPYLDKPK